MNNDGFWKRINSNRKSAVSHDILPGIFYSIGLNEKSGTYIAGLIDVMDSDMFIVSEEETLELAMESCFKHFTSYQ